MSRIRKKSINRVVCTKRDPRISTTIPEIVSRSTCHPGGRTPKPLAIFLSGRRTRVLRNLNEFSILASDTILDKESDINLITKCKQHVLILRFKAKCTKSLLQCKGHHFDTLLNSISVRFTNNSWSKIRFEGPHC